MNHGFPVRHLPYQFYGCEDPPPRRTAYGKYTRRIFGLPRQWPDKPTLQVCFISEAPANKRMGVGIVFVFALSLREHPML